MSLDKILKLIRDAKLHSDQAAKERGWVGGGEPAVINGLVKDAQVFLSRAHKLAMITTPWVGHPQYGPGRVVGVTTSGVLEVEFDQLGYMVAVTADSIRGVDR